MTAPMTSREALDPEERQFLEENIQTVAFHLGQPGARMSVGYDGGSKLLVDPGEVLKEISRRLGVAATPTTDAVVKAAREVWIAVQSTHDHTQWFEPLAKLGTALDAPPDSRPLRGAE